MPVDVLVLISFAAVTIAVLAVALLIRDLRKPNEAVDRRLGIDPKEAELARRRLLDPKPTSRIDRAFFSLLETSGRDIDGSTALAIIAGAAVIGCAVPLVLLENLLAASAGLVLGAALPIAWWAGCRSWRMRAMKKYLPETLEMLADGVRAGQTLEQAAQMVSAPGPKPLNAEFGYCAAQLKLGHSPVAVLARMARRVPLPEFKIFTTAVVVHRQTGGNLALLAQRLAGSARDRHEFGGHVRAVTAASRFSMVGLTIGTLVAVGILAWLQPEYLEVFRTHRLGPTLLATAAGLQLLGIVWVWRTLKMQF